MGESSSQSPVRVQVWVHCMSKGVGGMQLFACHCTVMCLKCVFSPAVLGGVMAPWHSVVAPTT